MLVVNGTSITSKSPKRMLTDLYAVETQGNKVRLSDDRWYWDWQSGLYGPVFGTCTDWWRIALQDAVAYGSASSIRHCDEQVVADMLEVFYPDLADGGIRFLLNGSDACAAAVKLARAVTGHDEILTYGYHGTCSAFAAAPTDFDPDDNRLGTMQAERDAYVRLDWLDGKLHEKAIDDIAAIVVECPPVDGGREESMAFLRACADEAHDVGALFVLDEVVTAFRYGPGGAAEYYDIQDLPDLYCFGKTLGNGCPVAALAGKRDVMQWLAEKPGGGGKVHWSNTWNGEPLGLAAAKATLSQLQRHPPWTHLYDIGTYLKVQWNALELPWEMVGHPTRPVLEGQTPMEDFRRFMFERRHIVVPHPWYVSTVTTAADVRSLCEAAKEWNDAL